MPLWHFSPRSHRLSQATSRLDHARSPEGSSSGIPSRGGRLSEFTLDNIFYHELSLAVIHRVMMTLFEFPRCYVKSAGKIHRRPANYGQYRRPVIALLYRIVVPVDIAIRHRREVGLPRRFEFHFCRKQKFNFGIICLPETYCGRADL